MLLLFCYNSGVYKTVCCFIQLLSVIWSGLQSYFGQHVQQLLSYFMWLGQTLFFIIYLLLSTVYTIHIIAYLLIKFKITKINTNLPSQHLLAQSQQWKHQKNMRNRFTDVIVVSSLLILDKFYTLFWCLHCWLWTSKQCLLIYGLYHLSTITITIITNLILLFKQLFWLN